MSPLDIDIHGNNAVHHAAASGLKSVLECFLSKGVDVDIKNARGHSPLDLATVAEVKSLITQAMKTKACVNCFEKFDFKNIRYYCQSTQNFYCSNCSRFAWVFESLDSIEKERPVCRSHSAWNAIENWERELAKAMSTCEFEVLDGVLKEILKNKIDIEVKLLAKAKDLHLKLDLELDIRTYISSLAYVDNFKTIKKSVKIFNDKVENAKERGVDLDPKLFAEVNKTSSRLISERNLRFQMDLTQVSKSSKDDVAYLQELIQKA